MPAYVIGDLYIADPPAFRAYVPVALATIARHGGRVIAGGNKIELLDGEPMPERIVIVEFPDVKPPAAGTAPTTIRRP